MKKASLYLVLLSFIVISSTVKAQNDLSSTLSRLSSGAAQAYVGPVVSAFGADLNSGWVDRVTSSSMLGLNIQFKIVAMGTFFSSQNQTFSTSSAFRFNRDQAATMTQSIVNPIARNDIENQIISQDFTVGLSGPTIVGDKNQFVSVNFPGHTFTSYGQQYTVPTQNIVTQVNGLLGNLPALPLAAPQLTVGTVYGTSVSLRYLPDIQLNSDLGKFSYFGFGIQHNPAGWFDVPLPVDFSVGFFVQNMKVGSIFTSHATMVNINASKMFGTSFLNVTPYAGIGFENSTISVNYTQNIDSPAGPQQVNISFDLKGENTTRFTLGASFGLAIVNLNVDYSFAKYNTLSAGLGFMF
ncbi:MAG: DUF6588 family protein [Ignavibacteriaceae bacterium]